MKECLILFFLSIILGCKKSEKEACFSKVNFDKVFHYLESNDSYVPDDLEIVLIDSVTICIKKNGYTLSKIKRQSGIVSPLKYKPQNEKWTVKTNQIFCELVLKSQ
ncbi:conserved hypothetical protein [Flavobacterium sp. 9AF]|uniref:hypothetical protein n=1 Tax=Flavobacterium sp. 9AF TaxID=2653142 RepID=UPI0012F3322D|nr:hypothetical protein [Flavobacterium sp. 9AF]VXB49263.1 conserved hypothetical protein [Flavobacterium sp. 9AF]